MISDLKYKDIETILTDTTALNNIVSILSFCLSDNSINTVIENNISLFGKLLILYPDKQKEYILKQKKSMKRDIVLALRFFQRINPLIKPSKEIIEQSRKYLKIIDKFY